MVLISLKTTELLYILQAVFDSKVGLDYTREQIINKCRTKLDDLGYNVFRKGKLFQMVKEELD